MSEPLHTCIFCNNELTADTKPEHILLNALGGRKTTRSVDCSVCNNYFGSTIDKAITDQVEVLRNMLGMPSGAGKIPPSLRNVQAGTDRISLNGDGTLDIVQKPFTLTNNPDGTVTLSINGRSVEEIATHIPNIAAMLKISEEKVIELLGSVTGKQVYRRPGTVHFNLSFGGHDATRSFTKSCLVLWATKVGNEELKSEIFAAARQFVVAGNERFNLERVHFDSRAVPHEDECKQRFGDFFNLIYIRSDQAGRVIGHFTMYNVLSWHMVLAEAGAAPNLVIALASNPLDPATWSDTIASEIDIPFPWLNTPDFTDEFSRAHQRLCAVMERSQADAMSREVDKIARSVFEKHGVKEGSSVMDPAIKNLILGEISQRVALHMMNLPHEETVKGEDIVTHLNERRQR
jgi:hypothetical protein